MIPYLNFLKSSSPANASEYKNQPDRPSIFKKHHRISKIWQCSTILVVGLTSLCIGSAASPAFAQQRIVEQYLDMNNTRNVLAIQTALRGLGYTIMTDGVFGTETRNVLLNFQRDNNLPVTGLVDNNTANILFARTQGVNPPSPSDGVRERFCRESVNLNQICAFVVLIPGDNDRLQDIKQRLLSSPYNYLADYMVLEDHPRGLFIRIGQYRERGEAEGVANMLRNNISPNFRVEYLPTVTPASARG